MTDRAYRFSLWSITGICVLVNAVTLKDGHNWGGDFSQYILGALNILGGRPYTANIMLDPVIVYPPGYPLLLVPVLKAFGVNFIVLKCVNVAFWAGAVLCIGSLLRRRCGPGLALAGAAFWASSFLFFLTKQNVISDMAFFGLVCAALWALEHYQEKPSLSWFAGSLGWMSAALLTRSAGIVLFAAVFLWLAMVKRALRPAAIVAGTGLAVIGAQAWITGGFFVGFFKSYVSMPFELLMLMVKRCGLPLESLVWCLVPRQMVVTAGYSGAVEWSCRIIAPVFWVWLGVAALYRIRRKRLGVIEVFGFLYSFVLLAWTSTYTQSAEGFGRFVLPALAAAFILVLGSCARRGWAKMAAGSLCALIALNLTATAINWDFNDDVFLSDRQARGMLMWLKGNLKADEHYMFWEPRPVALMTGRLGTTTAWLAANPPEVWPQILREKGVGYVAAVRGLDDRLMPILEATPVRARKIWQDTRYVIYRIP